MRETETRYKQAGADLARASGELERARDEIASLESEKMSLERNVSSLSAAQASLEKSLEQMKLDMTAQAATSRPHNGGSGEIVVVWRGCFRAKR